MRAFHHKFIVMAEKEVLGCMNTGGTLDRHGTGIRMASEQEHMEQFGIIMARFACRLDTKGSRGNLASRLYGSVWLQVANLEHSQGLEINQ